MTRIIAGRARGHGLEVPRSGTRPTTDRVREALFSAVASRMDLDGAAVADLFAGSGALGAEALSRGARTALFVERDARAAAVLRRNLDALARVPGMDGTSVRVQRSALPGALAGQCPEPGGFDLVLADPPYELGPEVSGPVLRALLDGGWLAPDALVVWERSSRTPAVEWPEGLEPEDPRGYGETVLELAWAVGTVSP